MGQDRTGAALPGPGPLGARWPADDREVSSRRRTDQQEAAAARRRELVAWCLEHTTRETSVTAARKIYPHGISHATMRAALQLAWPQRRTHPGPSPAADSSACSASPSRVREVADWVELYVPVGGPVRAACAHYRRTVGRPVGHATMRAAMHLAWDEP